jgi:Holliday junction resolvase RusA-like endonuclease
MLERLGPEDIKNGNMIRADEIEAEFVTLVSEMNRGACVIGLIHPGEPIPAKRARVTRWGTYTPPDYAQYKKNLAEAIQARFVQDGDKDSRYKLVVDAYRSNRRAVDVDNLAKSVMDALQDSGVILNDSQIDELVCRKHYDPKCPRVEFVLEQVP